MVEMQARKTLHLEEVRQGEEELEKEELDRLRKEVECKANSNRQVEYPVWRGNEETYLGLHPCLQSSPLDFTAKSSYELWLPLDNRSCSLCHTRHKEKSLQTHPPVCEVYLMASDARFWKIFF